MITEGEGVVIIMDFKLILKKYFAKRRLAKKCTLILEIGLNGEICFNKMANAKIFKPSLIEVENAKEYSVYLKKNIRNYINEIGLTNDVIERKICEIESINCNSIIDCIYVARGYFSIGLILQKDYISYGYKIIIGNFNTFEIGIISALIILTSLFIRLII